MRWGNLLPLLFAVITACYGQSTSLGSGIINQHTCQITERTLTCVFGLQLHQEFQTDRRMNGIRILIVDLAQDAAVIVNESDMPDLEKILVRSSAGSCHQVTASAHVSVFVDGTECVHGSSESTPKRPFGPSSKTTTRKTSTSTTETTTTTTTTTHEDLPVALALKVVVIVLSGCVGVLLFVVIPIILFIRTRKQTKPYVPEIEL